VAEGKLPEVEKVLKAFGKGAVARLQKALEKHRLVASGALFQSIDFRVKFFGDWYEFNLFFNPPGDKYAQAVNDGASPTEKGVSNEMIESIIKWTVNKGIQPKKRKRRRKSLKNPTNKDERRSTLKAIKSDERRSLAWAIAKKIQQKGTIKRFNYKGSKFWDDNVPPFIEDLKKGLSKAYKQDVLIEIKEIKKEFEK
jgi:hypothetical protein